MVSVPYDGDAYGRPVGVAIDKRGGLIVKLKPQRAWALSGLGEQ